MAIQLNLLICLCKAVVLKLFCVMDPFVSVVKLTDPFSEKCI
jgi:hypothetical protein